MRSTVQTKQDGQQHMDARSSNRKIENYVAQTVDDAILGERLARSKLYDKSMCSLLSE